MEEETLIILPESYSSGEEVVEATKMTTREEMVVMVVE